MVKFKQKQRVRLTQPIDQHTENGDSHYVAVGALGTVRSRLFAGKRVYAVEFDAVRDHPWYAGLTVTLTKVKTLDGQLHDVIDLCEAVNADDDAPSEG